MSELAHWHPVALSSELGRAPLRATLHGRDVVLFRSGDAVGALDDACGHRGFPLHRGRVVEGCVECPYHGWRWRPDGTGTCPASPRAKPRAPRWDAVERMGAVWIRPGGCDAPFPYVDVGGHTPVGVMRRRVGAGLEVTLDNFLEVEHTPKVHAFLGHPLARLAEVETRTTVTDDAVRVYNRGPQRWIPGPLRRVFDIPARADFVDDWTARFSPVHAVYEQYFLHAGTDARAGEALRIAVFFTPVGPRETDLFVFAYTSASRWERPLVDLARLPMVMALVRLEVSRDASLLAHMAGAPVALEGRALGRFDKALVASRRLLERVYRGRSAG